MRYGRSQNACLFMWKCHSTVLSIGIKYPNYHAILHLLYSLYSLLIASSTSTTYQSCVYAGV